MLDETARGVYAIAPTPQGNRVKEVRDKGLAC
jgi:hypothetical protein